MNDQQTRGRFQPSMSFFPGLMVPWSAHELEWEGVGQNKKSGIVVVVASLRIFVIVVKRLSGHNCNVLGGICHGIDCPPCKNSPWRIPSRTLQLHTCVLSIKTFYHGNTKPPNRNRHNPCKKCRIFQTNPTSILLMAWVLRVCSYLPLRENYWKFP